jgi:flagellar basal body P-ring formation protein FlgA
VMLVTVGNGFSISAEGNAMTKATEGQVVQVKVASGQVISGVARSDGKVEVNY